MAAFLPPGSAVPLCAETRFWPCSSGVLACKTLLIGSELLHSPVLAVLLFPIRAAPPAAGSSADTPSPVSGDSLHCLPQVPPPSPPPQCPLLPAPLPPTPF